MLSLPSSFKKVYCFYFQLFDLLMGCQLMKVDLRFSMMEVGELFAMITLASWMLMSSADNLDINLRKLLISIFLPQTHFVT